MNWLSWNDFLAPSNPFAALLFGIAGTLIVGLSIWFETKAKRTLLVAVISGVLTTIIGVCLLTFLGFY